MPLRPVRPSSQPAGPAQSVVASPIPSPRPCCASPFYRFRPKVCKNSSYSFRICPRAPPSRYGITMKKGKKKKEKMLDQKRMPRFPSHPIAPPTPSRTGVSDLLAVFIFLPCLGARPVRLTPTPSEQRLRRLPDSPRRCVAFACVLIEFNLPGLASSGQIGAVPPSLTRCVVQCYFFRSPPNPSSPAPASGL